LKQRSIPNKAAAFGQVCSTWAEPGAIICGKVKLMRSILATVALVGLFCLSLRAEITVKAYQKSVHSSDRDRAATMKLYVMGVGSGIAWANTAAEKNNAPLYCQPPNFSMNGDYYIDILDKTIKELESKTTAKELNEYPVGLIVLMGLQKSFPCQAAK
jgi:hypothetical protein